MEQARSADAPAPPQVEQRAPKPLLPPRLADAPAPARDAAVLDDAASTDASAAAAPDDAPLQEEARSFFDTRDEPLRTALRSEAIARVERGRGGRSLGFKIVLADGHKAYFKGEQTFSAANWFGEVAAYHLDRMLGFGRVPCVVSRTFAWSELREAAGNDRRKAELIVRDGMLRGAFVAWVDGPLAPLVEQPGWERWVRVNYWPSTAVSPFQRPAVWKRQLNQQRKLGNDFRSKEERYRLRSLRPEPDRPDRSSELSDLIVFDYLTRNLDRWGGNNANVLIRGPGGPLVFLDNGAGFEPGDPRPSLMEARLHVLQRFRRRTITNVRAFDVKRFEARLKAEPVQPVLHSSQIEALMVRRKALLEWVEEMERIHGEAIWAWQ